MLTFRAYFNNLKCAYAVGRNCNPLVGALVLIILFSQSVCINVFGQGPHRPSWLPVSPPPINLSTQENASQGYFTDLSSSHDGGVAHPADGSAGNALQQTLIDAYFWRVNHDSARATVVAAAGYEVYVSRLWVPSGITFVCSSFAPMTYTGGCGIHESDPGNNTPTGGSTLITLDYSIGVLSDHKTRCYSYDQPFKADCIVIGSVGAAINGMTLYGGGIFAGGADVGIRIAEDNVSVSNTATAGFFGGPGIQSLAGANQSYTWNYGTNVDMWWCNNSAAFTPHNLSAALNISDGNLGGLDLGMADSYVLYNQYSTGCAFAKNFSVGSLYPHMSAIHIYGANDDMESNLGQVDAIGLILNGLSHRIANNRFEYQGRELIRNDSFASIFIGNYLTSACLDPNLVNLRPGAPHNRRPAYPSAPTALEVGFILEDTNGNVEQVISGNGGGNTGVTDATAPIWPLAVGNTVVTTQLTFENVGAWEAGLTGQTDEGGVPAETSGICLPVTDYGIGNDWSETQVIEQPAVDGPSYSRGSYFIPYPGKLSNNSCSADLPDAFGNGQCWWGGDLFSNGGPPYLAPNGQTVSATGGGTAWVGDYSDLRIADASTQHYNNFQGMAQGQDFEITAANAPAEIDTWGVNGSGSVYGHPSVHTCNTLPLIITPGAYYTFHYDLNSVWAVTQTNCGPPGTSDLALTSSENPLEFGVNLLITASVSGAGLVPTGTVEFSIDGTIIQSSGVFGGTASALVTKLPVGKHVVSATYSGDVNYAQTESSLTETVLPNTTATLSPSYLEPGVVGSAYSQSFSVSGMSLPYIFSSVGSIPPGLVLSGTGVLSGVPTLAGLYKFTITAAAIGANQGATLSYAITVSAAPFIRIAPAAIGGAIIGVPYSTRLSATGGVAPYHFALASGSLPVGLTLSSIGMISGVPTKTSDVAFEVSATDSSPSHYMGTQDYTLVVETASSASVSTTTILLTPTSPTVVMVNPGGMAMYSFEVLPGGSHFSGDVSFSTSGLPSGSTVTLSPNMLPASSTGASLTVSIQTADSTSLVGFYKRDRSLGLLLMPLVVGGGRRLFRRRRRSLFLLLIVTSSIFSVTGLTGCGFTETNSRQNAYSMNITASALGATNSAMMTLIVR